METLPGQGDRVRTSSWGMEMSQPGAAQWGPEGHLGHSEVLQRMEGTGEQGELQRDASGAGPTADPATPSMLLRLRDFPQPREENRQVRAQQPPARGSGGWRHRPEPHTHSNPRKKFWRGFLGTARLLQSSPLPSWSSAGQIQDSEETQPGDQIALGGCWVLFPKLL